VGELLPPPGEPGRRVAYLAGELGCSPHQIHPALARLGDRITKPKRGEWTKA
jgi:hypothetical protein